MRGEKKAVETSNSKKAAVRESYRKAMKLTTIRSNGNGEVSKLSEEVIKLREEVTILKQSMEALDKKNFDLQYALDIIIGKLNQKIDVPRMIREEASKYYSPEELQRDGYDR
jgi:hypothetical protein